MSTMHVPQTPEAKQAKRAELVSRAKALGWRGQNELARRAGYRDPGFVSRVLRDLVKSPKVWRRCEAVLRRAERRRQRARAQRAA